MPISHESKSFAVQDAKIAIMTADPAGGSATYGTLIDVPAIKSIGTTWAVETKELRGDNSKKDQNSTLVGVSFSIQWGKLNYDMQAAILGGTVTDSGTTPAQKAKYRRLGANSLNYIAFVAKTPEDGADTIGGDRHLCFYKAILSGGGGGLAEEDYQIQTATFETMPRLADDRWWDDDLNEAALALAIPTT